MLDLPKYIKQNKKLLNRLEFITNTIIKNIPSLERIILFGSFARNEKVGDISEKEIDIIIIAPTALRFIDRLLFIRSVCPGVPSINPLWYTKIEFENLKTEGEGFLEDALEEGIIIYEEATSLSMN